MTPETFSRRRMLGAAALGAPALALSALPVEASREYGARPVGARRHLASLQAATPNKGGHRVQAMHLIEEAMGEVQAGLDFAYGHGGASY